MKMMKNIPTKFQYFKKIGPYQTCYHKRGTIEDCYYRYLAADSFQIMMIDYFEPLDIVKSNPNYFNLNTNYHC